jgi:ankyrin repeat protein
VKCEHPDAHYRVPRKRVTRSVISTFSMKMKTIPHILISAAALTVTGCLNPGSDGPLHNAATSRDLAAVQAQVQRGADVNATGMYGRTPLYYAALYGESNIVTYLLNNGADPKKGASWKGDDTPLHVSAEKGHIGCVEALLVRGVPVDIRNSANQTPLHDAARNRHPDVVKLLLDHGADIDATDKMGTTPLEYPSGSFENHQSNYQVTVEVLLAHGADVRHVDRNGETALHESVFMGNAKVVAILLDHGADPNISGIRGTPLEWAKIKQYEDILALLKKHGAKE